MSPNVSFEDEENDPVIAEYDVYMTPELQEQIYLLQYPNRLRDTAYDHASHTATGVRVKPKSGFMEIDLETNVHNSFDKKKGVVWGEAVRQTKESGTDSFGLASGFGKGARAEHFGPDATSTRSESDATQRLLRNFDRANDGGRVLNKQIIGGPIARTGKGRNILMLGAFHGDELYLTPIDGTVQMRPQFHHIDAQSQMSRNKYWREREAREGARAEPRIVQQLQVARSAADGEELNVGKSTKFLADSAEESWTRLYYRGEESAEAYAAYDNIFLEETANAPQLKASVPNKEYLDTLSAPRIEPGGKGKKNAAPRRQAVFHEEESSSAAETTSPDIAKASPKGKGKKKAAAPKE